MAQKPQQNKNKKVGDPLDAEVGHRIRIQRTARGMSQSALGQALGVTFQQVQKYEKGVNRVGAGRLTRIAGELGIPVSVLLGAIDQPSNGEKSGSASNVLECLSDRGAVRLVQAYAQIQDGNLKNVLVDLVEQMARKAC